MLAKSLRKLWMDCEFEISQMPNFIVLTKKKDFEIFRILEKVNMYFENILLNCKTLYSWH